MYDGVLGRRPVAVKAVHEGLFKDVEGGDDVVRNFCTECDRLKALEANHVISECLVLSQLAYIVRYLLSATMYYRPLNLLDRRTNQLTCSTNL